MRTFRLLALPLLALALPACGGSNKSTGEATTPANTPPETADPTVVGSLDKSVIRAEVRSHLPKISICHAAASGNGPMLAGTVVVTFTIQPDGATVVDEVKGFGSADLDACIGEVFTRMRFPSPEGGGVVKVTSYPFTFR